MTVQKILNQIKTIESSKKDINTGFFSSANKGLESAHYKYNDVRENIKARLDKINLTTYLTETGFSCLE